MNTFEQGRSQQQKQNNFKYDFWAVLVLVVLIILYRILR